MGMFDTIIFNRPIPCPKCGAEIRSDQTKAFECTLDDYRIGDCIAHAEEIRIDRGAPRAENCRRPCAECRGSHPRRCPAARHLHAANARRAEPARCPAVGRTDDFSSAPDRLCCPPMLSSVTHRHERRHRGAAVQPRTV